jgi:arsenate reductase-like glutaredoxin family protein
MGEKPPSRSEAIRLMAGEPNLIRRPVVISGARIVLGYDEEALRGLAGGRGPKRGERKTRKTG